MTDPEGQRVVHMTAEELEQPASTAWRRGGSGDYKTDSLVVERIVDRDGIERELVWSDARVELCPGITMFSRDRRRYLTILRAACPVRILFAEHFEYVSYDDASHNTSWTKRYWVRYEAAQDSRQ